MEFATASTWLLLGALAAWLAQYTWDTAFCRTHLPNIHLPKEDAAQRPLSDLLSKPDDSKSTLTHPQTAPPASRLTTPAQTSSHLQGPADQTDDRQPAPTPLTKDPSHLPGPFTVENP